MEADSSPYSDPTTDADAELLEKAAKAEAGPPALDLKPGVTEHPSGRVAAASLDGYEKPDRSAVRRHTERS